MNFEEYMPTVAKRCKVLPHREHQAHMAMGVIGEFGEVIEMVKKHTIYGKPLDRDALMKEVGDICWYVTGFACNYNLPSHLLEMACTYGTGVEVEAPDTEFVIALASVVVPTAADLVGTEPDEVMPAAESILVLYEMIGMVCGRFKLPIEEVLAMNDAKLAARYSDKFDAKQAIERKDEAGKVAKAGSIMGEVETLKAKVKWDGHGYLASSITGPGASPETDAFWDSALKIIEEHNNRKA